MHPVSKFLAVPLGGFVLFVGAIFAEVGEADWKSNPEFWPSEVAVGIPLQIPLMREGEEVGQVQAPAGRRYNLAGVEDGAVFIAVGEKRIRVAMEDTNFMELAEEIRGQKAADAEAADVRQAQAHAAEQAAAAAAEQEAEEQAAQNAPPTMTEFQTAADRHIVKLSGRSLSPVEESVLAGKDVIALYYSAEWCPPCRAFTPDLVRFYRRMSARHPQFELVFISSDKNEEDMLSYMRDYRMGFPAVAWDRKNGHPLAQFSGRGIPCLVVIDANGQVLSHSYDGETYVGPRKVLSDLQDLLRGSN